VDAITQNHAISQPHGDQSGEALLANARVEVVRDGKSADHDARQSAIHRHQQMADELWAQEVSTQFANRTLHPTKPHPAPPLAMHVYSVTFPSSRAVDFSAMAVYDRMRSMLICTDRSRLDRDLAEKEGKRLD